jgi:hypothetical protein
MRGRIILFVSVLCVMAALPEAAQAQLSPQGIFHTLTRPFRQMLGHFGPHRHHASPRHTANADPNAEKGPDTPSQLGMVGPPAWPSAYEDVLGYVFWPDEYAQGAPRGHGFDVIADTITGQFERARARVATTGEAAQPANPCNDAAEAHADWPAARIEQAAQLSDAQKKSLGALQAAVAQSVKTVKAGCHADAEGPPARLKALVQAFWNVRDAGVFIRAPLQDFAGALTDAQKSTFANPPPDKPEADSKKASQACAAANVESAERMLKTIERRVKPKKDQEESLENLHKASTDMAKLLMAACMKPIPADPLARLDASVNQLTAMNYATTTVQIAFDNFYGKLDDKQKERLERSER